MKLDIGCGEHRISPEHIGVDAYLDSADVKAPMWDLPYEDGMVDEIWCAHALEHVAKAQVVPTLKEWRRIIKPEGLIILHVPDLAWCCQNFLAHPDSEFALWTLYGQQNREGEYHLTGFTRAIMEKYLAEAELKLVEYNEIWTHAQQTLEFKLVKS